MDTVKKKGGAMNKQTQKAIIDQLKKPDCYTNISDEQWEVVVTDSLEFGGDWLEILVDTYNPIPADAVESVCVRADQMEAETKSFCVRCKNECYSNGICKEDKCEFHSYRFWDEVS